jgi:hypothetical protein
MSLFLRGEWMGWLDPGTGKQGRDCFLMGKFGDFVICEFFFVFLHSASDVGFCWLLLFVAAFYGLLDEFILAFIMFFIIIVEFEVR